MASDLTRCPAPTDPGVYRDGGERVFGASRGTGTADMQDLACELPRILLKRTSENPQNANFVLTEFYEVRELGIL